MTPEDELLAVFGRWRRRVEDLAIWSGGEARLHDLLQMAVQGRAVLARHNVEVADFPWETLVDQVSQWHYDHPLGTAEYSLADVRDAVEAALQATRVEPLEKAIRAGAVQVRKTGRAFRVRYRWDVSLEVADIYLERQARPDSLPGPGLDERQWAAGKSRETLNAFSPPTEVLRKASHRTAAAVEAWRAAQQEPSLPDDFALGDGLTVGIMVQVLACLMACAQLSELAHARVRHPGTTLIHIPREILLGLLAGACDGLSTEMAETAARRLMAGPKRSVRSSFSFQTAGSSPCCR